MTLLTPFKHITTFKLSRLSIFTGVSQLKLPQVPVILTQRPAETPMPTATSDPQLLPPTPQEVMAQIGQKLYEWREYHHLSIDDMSARTQIQPRLIQAIESGQIEILPESIYVKGMLKRYADNLGLDGTEISQKMIPWEPTVAKFTVISRQTPGLSPIPQLKPFQIYLGYTLVICGIGAGTSHLLNNAIKPQSTPITKSVIQSQSVLITPQTVSLPDVQVGIAVKNLTWAQIGIDGTTKFTGSLQPGTKFNWVAKKQVTISTNNAGGLLFSQDLQPLKPLGKIGEKQTITIKVIK